MNPIFYFIAGGLLLGFVIQEIFRRIKRKPLSTVIIEHEKKDGIPTQKKARGLQSFKNRAERVNWNVKATYQQSVFIGATIASAVAALIFDFLLLILAGVVLGLFLPYYQLKKKEDAYMMELPLRAEQAVNAVEQQMQSDIPTFEALKKATAYMQSPIREEYVKAVEKIERANMPIKKAVEPIPDKLQLPQLEYFHMILEVAEDTEEKAADIIRDASDTLRRKEKQRGRLLQEIKDSLTEMKWMYVLVVVMVLSLRVLLDGQYLPFIGTPLHLVLDIVFVALASIVTWKFMQKLRPSKVI
ncbi:type II secretion system F family protein [Salibacterium aidingense]|uniref:type II secretion system F family protein n=1 Tax=Salibacterium aidingense TaxID=384933 RepID=UPI0003F5FAA8|nr:hypothetical protein [Salibacterium aidingense]